MYKALELSGDDRVHFLDGPLPHVYYRMTANSTVFLDPQIKKADWAYVNALPAASKRALPPPVHIVTCAFARVALLQEVCLSVVYRLCRASTCMHKTPLSSSTHVWYVHK